MFSVLYVDDECDLLEIGKLFLEQFAEFSVDTHTAAQEALASEKFQSYDAIVSDYQMPGMDGIEFLRTVRTQYGDIPFILFTGRGREEVVIQAINNGADFYLQKGGDPEAQFAELAHKVRQAIARRRAQDELKAAYGQLSASEEELRSQLDEIAKAQQERTKTEENLRESEEKYRMLVEVNQDIIFSLDLDGTILYVSPQTVDQLGYRPDEMESRNFIQFVHTDDVEKLVLHIQEHFDAGKPVVSDQFRVRRKDGIYRRYEDKTIYATDSKGRQIVIGTMQDITERKRAEEDLFNSRQMLQAVLDTIPQRVFWKDRNSVFLGCNKPLALDAGYSDPAEIAGKTDYEHASAATADLYRADDRQVMETGQSKINYEEPQVRPDGSRAWLRTSKVPLRDEEGKIIGVLGTYEDITERKLAQEKLQESEEKYRGIFENTSVAVFQTHLDGSMETANPAFAQMLGYETPEKAIRAIPDIRKIYVYPDLRDILFRTLTDQGTVKDFEIALRRPDGSIVWASVNVRGLFDNDGKITGLEGLAVDITERKNAEEALRQSEERLQLALDGGELGTWNWNVQTGEVIFNQRWADMLGYRLEEVEPHINSWERLVHPDDIAQVQEILTAHLEGKTTYYECEHRLRKKNGTWIWVLDKGKVIRRDSEGRPLLAAGTHLDITRRKLAEQNIQDTNAFLNALIDQNPNSVWISDENGFFIRMNAACSRLLHSTGEELVGKYNIFNDNLVEEQGFMPLVKSVFEEGRVVSFPLTYDSSRLDVLELKETVSLVLEVTIFPIKDAAGKFTNAVIIHNDITERMRAEEALRQSEARLRSIMHGSPDLQFVIDYNHRVISWNKAIEKYSGINAADIIGTDQQWRAFYKKKRPVLADLLVDGRTDSLTQWYAGKLRKSSNVKGAYEATDFFPHMGTSGVWLSFTAAPIRDAQGTIIGAVETLEDVTERMNAEKALRESEERSRTILNTAQAGIIIVDAETHRIIDANRKALELIGLQRDSVIGMVCHRFICPAEEGKCPVTDCGQELDTSERVLLTATGAGIPVLKTVVPVSLSGRSVLVESFVDISGQKRSEAAIQEANRKLNLLNSITRHDVVNQISILRGFAKIAKIKNPDPVIIDLLGKIENAASEISRQIEFTKTYQELGMHAPCWNRIDEIIAKLKPDSITVSSTCKGTEIFADPMLEKVFFNLFDNAVRHGKKVTTITVSCRQEPDGLIVIVEDNGTGIPAEDKEKIFERGFGKNTGYGLFLVKEILTITGITIRETGIFGEGARFEMLVPKNASRFNT